MEKINTTENMMTKNILNPRVFQGFNENDWVVIGDEPKFTAAGKIAGRKTVYLHPDGTWKNTAMDKDSNGHFSSRDIAEQTLKKCRFPAATPTAMGKAFEKLGL